MGENKDYMTHKEDMGSIQLSEDVVASIAVHAAAEVDGVAGLMNANVGDVLGGGKKFTSRGVRVEMDENGLAVTLFIVARYGCVINDLAQKVQKAAQAALEDTTGFTVSAVNVHVGGISFNK